MLDNQYSVAADSGAPETEGLEGVRGEEHEEAGSLCWCRACLFGLRQCRAACCAA